MIRDATEADLTAIAELYAHHVLYGRASFEEAPPDVAELAARRLAVLSLGLPYLVAASDGRLRAWADLVIVRRPLGLAGSLPALARMR